MYPNKEITRIWVALNLAQRSAFKTIDSELKSRGLPSLNWYDILWELENSSEGLRPFKLKNSLLFEQSGLSRILRKMTAAELISEQKSAIDGRGKILFITDKGLKVRKEMWAAYGPMIHKIFKHFDDSDKMSIVTDALHSLIDRGTGKPFI